MKGIKIMVIRQISKNYWEHVYKYISIAGKTSPLCSQFDIEMTCNGVDYILKLQPDGKRKIAILQAVGIYACDKSTNIKNYRLI